MNRISMCRLSARDGRMIQMVAAHATFSRLRLELVSDAAAGERLDAAIVDAALPESAAAATALSARRPDLPLLYLGDQPPADPRLLFVDRHRLWTQLLPRLDSLLRGEQLFNRGAAEPAVTAATAAPAPQSVPAPAAACAPAAPRTVSPRGVGAAGAHALVVDDSSMVQAQMQAALAQMGLRVTLCQNAEQAHTVLRRERVNLLFLDVVMPGVDGYTFCRELRAQPSLRKLPVVMLTGQASLFDRARGALAGCDVYLTKPVDLARLRDTTRRILTAPARVATRPPDPVHQAVNGVLRAA